MLPFLHLPAFYESFLYLVLHWIVLATSWNILSGYSGYFSFGHGAFFGTGVYTTAVLAGKYDIPFLWTLPAAALFAALLGLALGAVVFRVRRVRGEVFALLTLAVTFVLATIVLNTPIDGGPGVYLSAVAVPALAPTVSGSFYMMALALAVVTLDDRSRDHPVAPGTRPSSQFTTTRTQRRSWAFRPTATSSPRWASRARSRVWPVASRRCSCPTSRRTAPSTSPFR